MYLADLEKKRIKHSGFSAISKYMFSTSEAGGDITIDESLLNFKNYCMILHRKVSTINNVYSISIPDKFKALKSIEDYNTKQIQEESEINNLKTDNEFVDYYSLKGLSFHT